jgi:hypothetical protein
VFYLADSLAVANKTRTTAEPKAAEPKAAEPKAANPHAGLVLHRSRGLLDEHLQRLAALPAHGNRTLRFDQLFLGLLMAFFEPMVRSLRVIEGCGDFDGRLNLPRLARSTTADALAVFDPGQLRPLLEDLRRRVPGLEQVDTDLATISRRIIAADGTYLNTLANVAWALHHRKRSGQTQGQVRANVQLDVADWTPRVITISGDDAQSEPAAFIPDLQSGVLYVVDRNFCDFSFLKAVLSSNGDFVLRIKANAPGMAVLDQLPLSAADVEAGVIADQIVELTGRDAPPGRFRKVTVQITDRHGQPQTILLLSSLTDPQIPALAIAAAYRQRWQIELFFKWLKTFARMDHLLSTSRQGITLQLYVAVIAVLMMHVQSGHRVSIYTLHALSRVARGQMSLEQAMAVIQKREHERSLDRARQARRRARKKLV